MIFDKRFKKIRKEMGISQEKIAELLNVTRQAVTKWETGMAMPDIDNLIQLSELFQVPLDYLVKDRVEYIIPPKIPVGYWMTN